MGSHSRIHYMDNLRAFAMLLGIFFHAALAYSPLVNQLWPTADTQNAVVVDVLAFFSHTFRMPLFFIIAGFFTALLIQKRGLANMLKNRLQRIALPFVIFLPLVLLSLAIIFGWAMNAVEHQSPMLAMISMMANMPEAPQAPITTTHLWFLYNLIFFYLLTWVAVKYIRFDWMAQLVKSPVLFLLLAPLLLVPAYITQHAPLPAPEQFTPQLWSLGSYGLFFTLGYGLYKYEGFLDQLESYSTTLFIIAIAAFGYFFSLLPESISMQEAMVNNAASPALNSKQFMLAILQSYIGVYMCLVLLIIGRRYCTKQSSAVRVIADSSYWIYIIHLPVLWVIQFALLDTSLPLLVEFLISSLGTILIGFVSYLVVVKHTPIGWLLNGRKSSRLPTPTHLTQ